MESILLTKVKYYTFYSKAVMKENGHKASTYMGYVCTFWDGKLWDWGTTQGWLGWGEPGVVLRRGGLWTEQKFLHACGHISEAEGEPCHWQWPHVLQHSGPWFVHLVEHLSWS